MTKCICGSTDVKVKFRYNKKPLLEKSFKISKSYKRFFYKCNVCGHMFAKNFFSVPNMYSKQYFELVYGSSKGLLEKFKFITKLNLKKSDNKNRVNRVYNFVKSKNLSLLDVGSGSGVFLYEMKKKGFDVSGFETDPRYLNFCKKELNIKMYDKSVNLIKKKYDLVTLNKVLEHIKNPINLLKTLKKKLKNKGYLYVEVPDIMASNKGKNRQEFGLEHFHVFSISSLERILTNSGFIVQKIARIHEPSDKYTLYVFAKKNLF